jgi:hypothetical protein
MISFYKIIFKGKPKLMRDQKRKLDFSGKEFI